jgi:hypothetical protein
MKGVLTISLLTAVLTLPAVSTAADGCMVCHEGIEQISDGEVMSGLTCVDCHMGNPEAESAEDAHLGMYANPSDMRVIGKTCGRCHHEEVRNLKTSLHATSAGIISGARYAWGAQERESIYGTYAVEDETPRGEYALQALKGLPFYDPSEPEGPENHPVDDYLRNQCLRCHIWSDGHQRDGDYRASGCAACHVLYSDAGTYEGNDKAIPADQKDRPRFHRITTKIPDTQCLHCHNRGGRTGVSYIGTMESDGYGTPWTPEGGKQPKLHGKHYNHLTADVHYRKGLTCIDCHTMDDSHGDGNIYGKREQAVEIECVDCHGTLDSPSAMRSSRGNELHNLHKRGEEIVLVSKLDGKEHPVPQISRVEFSDEGRTAMVAVNRHLERLECYACHARWAPQCYGCHTMQNVGKPGGDWLNGKPCPDASKRSVKSNREETAFSWSESRSYLSWETPALGINSEGRVSTFIPGCQVVFTQVDGDTPRVNNRIYTTVDGTSGIGTNPIQPHTVSKEARSCADCHATPKALGLGSGHYVSRDNGLPIDFELERIVDEDGVQIQQTAHEGARPFNKDELSRVSRAGTCIACHGADDESWTRWAGMREVLDLPSDSFHEQAIRTILGAEDVR